MNAKDEKALDPYRSFQLLAEIDGSDPLSQRELSRRLGIAVGLVNSYLKNLVAKGYVRVKNFPRNRYGYLLTPDGIAEKSRLAYHHLTYFTNLYTTTRHDYLELFRRLEHAGVRQVYFCGVDEVAEIAYLSLQETSIVLAGVMDRDHHGQTFFGSIVQPLLSHQDVDGGPVVITSLKRAAILREELLRQGIAGAAIHSIGGAPESMPGKGAQS